MFYHLIYPLHEQLGVLNVFKYISFRSFMAIFTAFAIALWLGPAFIRFLKKRQIGQSVRDDGPQSHLSKKGTPTMGGGLIIISLVFSVLLWADLSNPAVWTVLFILVSYGLVGWVDDWKKVVLKDPKGLSARAKMLFLILPAVAASLYLYSSEGFSAVVHLPFFKEVELDLGWSYMIFSTLVIVGSSNAVNLTDGLDGLAIGPVITSSAAYGLLAYLAGHAKIAAYLQIPFVAESGELAIVCASMLAAGMGFLWFNAYPAQMFMGDVGALSLGGAIGTIAVITKNEILLVIIGGVFVVETLSVVAQVASFKLRGKRVLRMAPLHHHFELKGWAEPKVIVRFWVISWILAILALSTLKLR
jgi:phospho-N-acetylmuramoyl-pentapeptide-transferase